MADDGATLSGVHDAIEAAVREAIPVLDTVGAYTVGDAVNTPAALIELEAAEEGEDDGSGRVPVRCTWTIHCLLSRKTERVEVEIRDFATKVLALVRQNRWGMPALMPDNLQAGPGEFSPGQDGYEGWYVTWEQTVYIGPDVWVGDGLIASTVYIGRSPAIGEGHAEDYDAVHEEA